MSLRCTVLLSGAALALAMLLLAGAVRLNSTARSSRAVVTRSRPPMPVTAEPHRTDASHPRVSEPEQIDTARTAAMSASASRDVDPGCAAMEQFAMRDPAAAFSAAMASADEPTRRNLLAAALRGWAQVDLSSAGKWLLSQSYLDHRDGFLALFAGAAAQPEEAIRFAREIARTNSAEGDVCREALISAFCNAGRYEQAARYGSDVSEGAGARLNTIYSRWAAQTPESAWQSALALKENELRLAALEGAVHAWSGTDPRALAENARQLASGPERTLALTIALRAWLDRDLDAASAWVFRWEPTGTLASVDLDLVLEQ
jgi:hypothetical protein